MAAELELWFKCSKRRQPRGAEAPPRGRTGADGNLLFHLRSMRASLDRITLTLAQRARLGNGAAFAARRNGSAPPTPDLVLYEYEA